MWVGEGNYESLDCDMSHEHLSEFGHNPSLSCHLGLILDYNYYLQEDAFLSNLIKVLSSE
jgi:hypothetical protein